MTEIYGGGSRKKYIAPGKVKKMIKKMQKSYKIGDKLKEKEEINKHKEVEQADRFLDEQLDEVS